MGSTTSASLHDVWACKYDHDYSDAEEVAVSGGTLYLWRGPDSAGVVRRYVQFTSPNRQLYEIKLFYEKADATIYDGYASGFHETTEIEDTPHPFLGSSDDTHGVSAPSDGPVNQPGPIGWRDASLHVGEHVEICGDVASTNYGPGSPASRHSSTLVRRIPPARPSEPRLSHALEQPQLRWPHLPQVIIFVLNVGSAEHVWSRAHGCGHVPIIPRPPVAPAEAPRAASGVARQRVPSDAGFGGAVAHTARAVRDGAAIDAPCDPNIVICFAKRRCGIAYAYHPRRTASGYDPTRSRTVPRGRHETKEENMEFHRIVRPPLGGMTLFGKSLDSLISEEIDLAALKEWADTFAELIPGTIDTSFADDMPFRDAFEIELGYFCIRIAASDGGVSDAEIAATNRLIDYEPKITRHDADHMVGSGNVFEWARHFPFSFMWLVANLGGQSDDVITAAQVAYFYRQVARYIYSVDNSGEFLEDSSARDYVECFFKYVERTSPIDFLPAEDEYYIEEICNAWERLVEEEEESTARDACGTWMGISGDALSSGALSDLVLMQGGRGYMLKRRLFGQKKVEVSWSVSDWPSGGTHVVMIRVPGLSGSVLMLPMGPGQMAATVRSDDPRLNLKGAMYRKA